MNNDYKLVQVHWTDAGHKQGWMNAAEVADYLERGSFTAVTVGYEVAENEDFLAIAQGVSGILFLNVVRIPKGIIQKTVYPQLPVEPEE